MKIVYVTPRLPYPSTRGDRIRAHHHLRHLCRHHEVHLVSLVGPSPTLRSSDTPSEKPSKAWIESFASISLASTGSLATTARLASAFATATPLVTAGFSAPQLRHAVERRCASDTDILWICNGALLPTLADIPARHRVVDLVDADSDKWRQMAEHHGGPRALLYRREARLTRDQEAAAAHLADARLVVSAAEADYLRTLDPDAPPPHVVSNGVDLDSFPLSDIGETPVILFTGALDYEPNIDAILFFAREVLPGIRRQIPSTQFLAVGSRPSRRLHRAARRCQFDIVGNVADVRPYFARARAVVAPIRLGRGLQNKVLEAMASGLPVVATPLALAGLKSWHEETTLCAETPAALVGGCVELLTDRDLAGRLAASGRRFVAERHRWRTVFGEIDTFLAELRATECTPDAADAAAASAAPG